MVDIPEPRVTALTQGPRPAVAGGEIRSAFSELSQGLDQIETVAGQSALEQASVAGENAVYRDENGDYKYDPKPAIGRNNIAFNRAAQTSYVAQMRGETQIGLAKIRADANGDINAFQKSAQAYSKELLKKKPPELRGPLSTILGQEISAQHEGMIRQQTAIDLQNHKESIDAEIKLADEDAQTLASSGGTGSKEYQAKLADIRSLMGEKVKNPLFGFTQQQAEVTLRRMEGAHAGEMIISKVQDVYDGQGLEAARKFTQTAFDDPSLPLTPVERRKYQGIAYSALRQFRGENAIDRQYATEDARILREGMTSGQDVADEDVHAVSTRLKQTGAFAQAIELERNFAFSKFMTPYKTLPDKEQTAILERMKGGGDYFARLRQIESGQNPNSSAHGNYGFIDATRRELGLSQNPTPAEEDAAIRKFTEQNRTQLVKGLGREPTPGELYLAHQQGAGGALNLLKNPDELAVNVVGEEAVRLNGGAPGMTAGQFAQKWIGKFEGGGFDPKIVAGVRKEVASDMHANYDSIIAGAKRGEPLSSEDAALLGRQMALVGDEDFATKVKSTLLDSGLLQAGTEPVAALEEALARTREGGVAADEQDGYQAMAAMRDNTVSGLKNDPIGLAARRIPNFNLKPVDFTSPTLPAVLADRQRQARLTEQTFRPAEPVPALTANEIDVAAGILSRASPQDAAAVFGTMAANLKPDTYMATMAKVAEKTAPALSVAGGLFAEAPAIATSVLRGTELLKQTPTLVPKKTDANTAATQDAMPYTAFAPGQDQAREAFLDAAHARYADLSATAGDTSGEYSETRMDQAIKDVTGGFVTFNGSSIMPPERGMAQSEFNSLMQSLKPRDVAGARGTSGNPLTIDAIRANGVLRGLSHGRYLIQMTGSSAQGLTDNKAPYARDSTNRTFILDLTPAARHQREVGDFFTYGDLGRRISLPQPTVASGAASGGSAEGFILPPEPAGLDFTAQ